MLLGLVWLAGAAMYRAYYSPSAFVERYLTLLANGRAADALALPGVAVDAQEIEQAGLDGSASEALLRRDALAALTDIHVVSESGGGEVTRVTVTYKAAGAPGTTSFDVTRDGAVGLLPTWRFDTSPLAMMNLSVVGSMSFQVNGFPIDKRQISLSGAEADPSDPVHLLVFSPGIYAVSVDTATATAAGVAVLSDSPFQEVAVEVTAEPTSKFIAVVQQRMDEFLAGCTRQEVLFPSGCPFGYTVTDRLASEPEWSIVKSPQITVAADGSGWSIPNTDAVAHLEVEVRSLFDGSISTVSVDVPFQVSGSITILADGSASISVTTPDE